MNQLAFVFLFLISPEQSMTRDLRAAKEITVEYGGETIVVQQPGRLLAKLRVTHVRRLVTGDTPPCRIWFGDSRPLWLWEGSFMTTDESSPVQFAPCLSAGFTEALNETLSQRIGRKIDVTVVPRP